MNGGFALQSEVLATALDVVDMGILLVDRVGCIAFANPKAASFLNCDVQGMVGKAFREFMHSIVPPHTGNHKEFARWIDLVDSASPVSGADLKFDCEIENEASGQKRVLRLAAKPVDKPEQTSLKTVITISEVSRQSKAERILQSISGGSWLLDVLGPEELDPAWEVASRGAQIPSEPQEADREIIASKEMSVIFRITQEMKKLLDLDDLLNHILYIVSTEMRYTDCSILLPDEKGENLVISAGLGMSQEVLGLKIPRGTGVSWWVMEHGQPQNVPDVAIDDRYYKGAPDVASEVYVPLEVRGKRLGVLVVQKAEKYGFTPTDVKLLMALAGHIASALEVAQLHSQVKKAAETDSLTGLYNRRSTVSALDRLLESAKQNKGPECISIVLLDVDRMKSINDNFGHLAGDRVLVHISQSLKRGFRADDIVGRFGGDEFIVLLPGVRPELACGRIKSVISGWLDAKLTDLSGRHIPVPGASFGISCYPADGDESRVLMAAADNQLLAAKAKSHEKAHESIC